MVDTLIFFGRAARCRRREFFCNCVPPVLPKPLRRRMGADYHRHWFGEVAGIEMRPSAPGAVWVALPKAVPEKWTDAFLKERALWFFLNDQPEASRLSFEEANRMVKELADERF